MSSRRVRRTKKPAPAPAGGAGDDWGSASFVAGASTRAQRTAARKTRRRNKPEEALAGEMHAAGGDGTPTKESTVKGISREKEKGEKGEKEQGREGGASAMVAESIVKKEKKSKRKKSGDKKKVTAQVVEDFDVDDVDGNSEIDGFFELPVPALHLTYKGAPKFVMLRDQPVKLNQVRMKKKSTNMGNDRIELKGHHIETGKLYVDTIVGTVDVPVLKVKFTKFLLLDVDSSDGNVTLMDSNGNVKEDAFLATSREGAEMFDAVGQEVISRTEAGEELDVVVFRAMGKEVVVECKATEDDE
jgi:hypothetical protein